jgi:hypothetical protein
MSAQAQTLPIGGPTNWRRWALLAAVAVAVALAASLTVGAVHRSGTTVPTPRPVPSLQIQAPSSPGFAPAGDSSAAEHTYYAYRLRLSVQHSADRPGWVTGTPTVGTSNDAVPPALPKGCWNCK